MFENFKKSSSDLGNEVRENNKSDFPDFFDIHEQNHHVLEAES